MTIHLAQDVTEVLALGAGGTGGVRRSASGRL